MRTLRLPRRQAEAKMQEAMMSDASTSHVYRVAPNRRQVIVGAALAFGGFAVGSARAWARAGAQDEISHSSEAIHMEVVFQASRKRVYEALTDATQFEKVMQLSAAMKSGMALGDK